MNHKQRKARHRRRTKEQPMADIYQADVIMHGKHIDTLEVGGDDGSLPPLDMGPATAEEELQQLAVESYGRTAVIGPVRRKGATG
jgi:hypothetical protein